MDNRVKELSLSKLFGYNYPSSNKEDQFFQKFFHQSRLIKKNHYLLLLQDTTTTTTTAAAETEGEDNYEYDYFDHIIPELTVYPYRLDSILNHNLQEIEEGVTTKEETRVLLTSARSQLMQPYPTVLTEAIIDQYTELLESVGSFASILLPLPTTFRSSNTHLTSTSQYYRLQPTPSASSSSPSSAIGREDIVKKIKPQLAEYLSQWNDFLQSSSLTRQLRQILQSRFLLPHRAEYCSLQIPSGKMNLMIQNSLLVTEEDICGVIHDCCKYFGISLFQIESSLLTMDQSKLDDLKSSFPSSSSNLSQRIFRLTKDHLKGPSVFFISNFDTILQHHNTSQAAVVPAETVEELFLKHFSKAIEDAASGPSVLFVATTTHSSLQQFPSVQSLFPIFIPSTQDSSDSFTKEILKEFLEAFNLPSDEKFCNDLQQLTLKTIRDKETLISIISSYYHEIILQRYESTSFLLQSSVTEERVLPNARLFRNILEKSIATSSELLNSGNGDRFSASQTTISPVYWDDIGGLESVRKELLDVLELPYKYSDYFPPNSPRRIGILLYGPPGTGKTLVAKAVATECKMSFLSIKGPELLDSYVGESEKNIRDLFLHAIEKAPCVMFFDEIDSVAPARARGNDSGGGVMDRMVSQFLTEMDQLRNSEKKVFVIAATNRPDLLDPALLRPGRFDRRIYLGASKGKDSKIQILQSQLRKFQLQEDVNLSEIADHLPDSVTGADIGSVSSDAFKKALSRKLQELNQRYEEESPNAQGISPQRKVQELAKFVNQLTKQELQVLVSNQDFVQACLQLKPTMINTSHYEQLQRKFENI